ncbi:MAG TPA: DUF3841 domain-containing protein [Bacillota bacterium]|nr:DUF3841 domain-containing protein [Bacillota bacterium]
MEEEQFVKAYAWMTRQMIQRIGEPPAGVEYPIWAWHTIDWKYKKPDLRKAMYGTHGERMACIEFEAEPHKVLLSDEMLWHHVLGDYYIGTSRNEEEYEKEEKWLDALSDAEQKKARRDSWRRVFKVAPSEDNDWYSVGEHIQATVWEVRWEQIRKVQLFTAR